MPEIRKHISVEGNIASGKSSFLLKLQQAIEGTQFAPDVQIYPEPVESWISYSANKHNLLNDMYLQKTDAMFRFQNVAATSKVLQRYQDKRFNFVERSLATQKNIFIRYAKENNLLSDLDFNILDDIITCLTQQEKMIPDIILYIDSDPVECFQNTSKRGRSEESKITVDYLTKLHDLHTEWINSITTVKILKIKYSPMNSKDYYLTLLHDIIKELL